MGPLWKSLNEDESVSEEIKKFAQERVDSIDHHPTPLHWRIYGVGRLPDFDWSYKPFTKKHAPYKITEKDSSPPSSCSSEKEVLLPTTSWNKKIATRHAYDYHPLIYTKNIFRLPIAVTYGLVGVSTGLALGVAGCGVGAMIVTGGGHGNGEAAVQICSYSFQGAAYIIKSSGDLTSYVLKPDLRRWKKLPAAIYLTQQDKDQSGKCLDNITSVNSQALLETAF